MAGFLDGIGALLGKATQWIPSRRESLNNTIDNLKKEMLRVQKTEPFDAVKYSRLGDQLCKAIELERRAET